MKKSRPSDMDLAFHSYAQSDAEFKKSEISTSSFFLPSLVSKLCPNERNETRLAAIRALIESFTKNCAHSVDDRMSDVAISSLRDIILTKKSKNEHNEALRLICAFSLGRRSEFSVRARMLINDLLPSIENLSSEYDAYRTFAISFLVANSIEGREDSLEIFKAFLDAFINATTTIVRPNKNQNKAKAKSKKKTSNENSASEDNGNSNTNNDNSIQVNENENKHIDDDNNNKNPPKEDNENSNTSRINDDSIPVDDNENENRHINDDNNCENSPKEDNENNNNSISVDDNQNTSHANLNVNNNDDSNISVNDNQSKNNHINEVNNNENFNDESVKKELIKPKEEEKTNSNDSNQFDQKATENSSINTNTQKIPTINSTNTEFDASSTFSMKRKSKFRGSTQSLRELLQGITLIVSSLPAEASSEYLYDEITTVINVSLGVEIGSENQKEEPQIDPLIAVDALDLFLVVHECLVERQEELHVSQSSDNNKANNFVSHFKPYIESIHRKANFEGGNKGKNKAREKSLRAKVADVLRCIDGLSKRTIDLAFNEQRVTIEGARKVVVADAVKRVTQKNFLSHLQANVALQSDLGFSLVSNKNAVKLMKRFKPEIKQERVMSKKEREMNRMKKRKMKENENKSFDD